jgi:hypothetical protein
VPELSPQQMTRLRSLLAVPSEAPDPSGEDLLAVLEAQQTVDAASDSWHGLDTGPWDD